MAKNLVEGKRGVLTKLHVAWMSNNSSQALVMVPRESNIWFDGRNGATYHKLVETSGVDVENIALLGMLAGPIPLTFIYGLTFEEHRVEGYWFDNEKIATARSKLDWLVREAGYQLSDLTMRP